MFAKKMNQILYHRIELLFCATFVTLGHSFLDIDYLNDNNISCSDYQGFKMLYTILDKSEAPTEVRSNGGTKLLNCSGPGFAKYGHHLKCNLVVNCVGNEDEENCSYTSQECGQGVDFGNKCLHFVSQKQTTWLEAQAECSGIEQNLITLKNGSDLEFVDFIRNFSEATYAYFIGTRTFYSLEDLYLEMWQWSDQTLAYDIPRLLTNKEYFPFPSCAVLRQSSKRVQMLTVPCDVKYNYTIVCEKYKDKAKNNTPLKTATLPQIKASFNETKVSLVACPAGHLTRDFLEFDLQSKCHRPSKEQSTNIAHSVTMPMFRCAHITQFLHYTFVCDYRNDCFDGSDETFCIHRECSGKRCDNGQCVTSLITQKCDGVAQCVDKSDERNCFHNKLPFQTFLTPPLLVNFIGKGRYSLQQLIGSCSETHFECTSADYCLPLYVLCNGVADCPDGEDELNCSELNCPGYYRCRDSSVCLLPDHLCDGLVQCPQGDDEYLCNRTCPDGCVCQGLALRCNKVISAVSYPDVRFLDASGTGMTWENASTFSYLIRLHLRQCNITTWPNISFRNLQILDLSQNNVAVFDLFILTKFSKLKELDLSFNPITTLQGTLAGKLHVLSVLSLSGTLLTSLDTTSINGSLNEFRQLNVSHNRQLRKFEEKAFDGLLSIEVLDLRGCLLENFPPDLLQKRTSLKQVFADDFRICCKAFLPPHMDQEECKAPQDFIASCEDLLRSNIYRFCLWVAALLALLGNVGSFLARARLHTESLNTSFSVLVTNLGLSDFIMGLYLVIIGVADSWYRNSYFLNAGSWKNSAACRAAGFLCLLSTEVSTFFICLITLDRLLLLRFPLSSFHMTRKSALVASGLAWILGTLLAAIPLLPKTSHWQLYSQTGICMPLPFNRPGTHMEGQTYTFVVLIVVNFVLLIFMAAGQVSIYLAIRSSTRSLVVSKSNVQRDATIARRLTTIVLTDFLCWFPVGLLGFLAYSGTPIREEVNVGVAILVLPLNSALNPFLYTFNIVMEARRKKLKAKFLMKVETQYASGLSQNLMPVSKESVLNQIDGWLGIKVITKKELAENLGIVQPVSDSTDNSTPVAKETAFKQLIDCVQNKIITMKELADRFDMMPRMADVKEMDDKEPVELEKILSLIEISLQGKVFSMKELADRLNMMPRMTDVTDMDESEPIKLEKESIL